MARLVRRTIRRALLVGIALTISGLVGSASGQANLAGASAQVFRSDSDSNSGLWQPHSRQQRQPQRHGAR